MQKGLRQKYQIGLKISAKTKIIVGLIFKTLM